MKIERDKAVQFFLDESSGSARTVGEPYLQNADQTHMFCPKCLKEADPDAGYGLAFGGMGTYWLCEAEGCEWFYKIMDPEELCEDEGCPQFGTPHVCIDKEKA